MSQARIPYAVATVVGDVLGSYYYSHRLIDMLFVERGAPGMPPVGNCTDKCTAWLIRASDDPSVDALQVLGRVLEDFMETDTPRNFYRSDDPDVKEKQRARVVAILAKHGLAYRSSGRIVGGSTATPTRSLESILRAGDLAAVELEFNRALENVETDPGAAITAACALVESLCKVYIEDENLTLPSDQSIKPLWKVVQAHLGFDPAKVADDDLKRILTGMTSVIDGMGAFRTHTGSAHGQGRTRYKPEPRHARIVLAGDLQQQLFDLVQAAQPVPRDGVGQARAQHDEFMLALVLRGAVGATHGVVKPPQLALGARIHVAHAADYAVRLVVEIQAVGDQLLQLDLRRTVEPWTIAASPVVPLPPSRSDSSG
jgi:hypothetical protein